MTSDDSRTTTLIRNSTAEFLIFTSQAGEQSIEARYEDETIWLTQQMMTELFQTTVPNISMHIRNIYDEGELAPMTTVKKSLTVRQEGHRQVKRELEYYSLDMVISVGYRVNSRRVNADKPNMGLTSWENAPSGKILKSDVSVAKNYLSKEELEYLGGIVNAYLELTENWARRRIPMTMEDWSKRLDAFLEFDDWNVLQDAGKVTAKLAKEFAESEFEKYRIVQDRLFKSDFDKELTKIEADLNKKEDND